MVLLFPSSWVSCLCRKSPNLEEIWNLSFFFLYWRKCTRHSSLLSFLCLVFLTLSPFLSCSFPLSSLHSLSSPFLSLFTHPLFLSFSFLFLLHSSPLSHPLHLIPYYFLLSCHFSCQSFPDRLNSSFVENFWLLCHQLSFKGIVPGFGPTPMWPYKVMNRHVLPVHVVIRESERVREQEV